MNILQRFLLLILDHRPHRKVYVSASSSSKIKKASASKRQRRDDDPNDEDYAPNQSDLATESSAAEDSDESMEGAHGSDDDEVIDVQSMNLPGRRWTAESYANARSVNQLHQDRDTNVLFFKTQVQQDVFFGHMLNKMCSVIRLLT